ncbi:MAG: hypothetical protein ACLP51_17075 [Syntrophobacteraceae bacterium]
MELLISTHLVPGGNTKRARAGWGDIRFTCASKEEPGSRALNEIYYNEVKMFEFPHVLPRSTIYYGKDLKDNAEDILRRLEDPSFNVWEKALICGCRFLTRIANGWSGLGQVGTERPSWRGLSPISRSALS